MKKFLIILTIFSLIYGVAATAHARNPFGAPAGNAQMGQGTMPNPIYLKLASWQHNLNKKLTTLMNESKESGSLKPFLSLIALAFLYGILHAAGPGHGKTVAATFLIARGRKIKDGIFVGTVVALLHGASGISLVLFIRLVLRSGVMGPLEEITQITKLTSYSLITLTGAILLCKSLYNSYRNSKPARHVYSGAFDPQPAGSLTMAIIIGMVPCPGTVLIMLYATSINMIVPGILLAVAQTLGMAFTISMIGALVVAGKVKSLDVLDHQRSYIADKIELTGATLASIAILTVGSMLLMTTLY